MQENLNLVAGSNIELIRTGDDVSVNNTYEYDDSGIEAEIEQLETSLQNYSLITETGNKVQIELNNTNYKMKVKLLDKNDNVINTSNEIDLPIEQLVKSITYDSETKEIVFTLQDGTQTRVPLSDLISGLVTEDDFNESQEEQNETIEALKEKVEVYKTIFNALPHIEDEDTEMTLDDTANSVMEMTLKGNTSQYTTTGKNKFNVNSLDEHINNATISNNTIICAGDTSFHSTLEGTNLKDIANLEVGQTYILTFDTTFTGQDYNKMFVRGSQSYWNNGDSLTITQEMLDDRIAFYGTNNSVISNIMIRLSTESDTYEPYTGGQPSPSPDFPQQIHKVSGDNEVVVCGKNIFNSTIDNGGIDTTTGNEIVNYGYARCGYIQVIGGKEISVQYKNDLVAGQIVIYEYDENKTYLGFHYNSGKTFTRTLENNTKYIRLRLSGQAQLPSDEISNVMVEYSSTPTTYESYQSQSYSINLPVGAELCKIGDYQDYFTKNTGKNLCKSVEVTGGNTNVDFYFDNTIPKTITLSATLSSQTQGNSIYLNIDGTSKGIIATLTGGANTKQSVTITLSDENYQAIQSGTNTFFRLYKNNANFTLPTDAQLEAGSSATDYEPYGTGEWFLRKNIGKVIFNGSENGWGYETQNSIINYRISLSTALGNDNGIGWFCNYFNSVTGNQAYNGNVVNGIGIGSSKTLRIRNTEFASTDAFKAWLSTHNTELIYVIATSTGQTIPDSLKKQLDEIEKAMSYKGQTNINQVNNDKPFIISASALKDLTNLESGE